MSCSLAEQVLPRVVNLYFVASPLQYLAAQAIAHGIENGGRHVLVYYKAGVAPIVVHDDWDAVFCMPWPRFNPQPGRFGRLRRLLENIEVISGLVGSCDILNIHSAVFDTEAINYFLRALPKACGATQMRARILPDGLINIRRYPLNPLDWALQYLRKFRRLADARLDYWCFSGDRIGSEAPFCDRIYVIAGLPHDYPADKVMVLPPLFAPNKATQVAGPKRALVIGQPLVGAGLMSRADLDEVSREIRDWLSSNGYEKIDYKGHPKDPNNELLCANYTLLDLHEPIETWMSKTRYDAVVGVRSSVLLFARQMYPPDVQVAAFGWDRIKFKSAAECADIQRALHLLGVERVEQQSGAF
jgi:hypothetical protein